MKKSNRETLTLSLTGQIVRESKKLERLTGQKLNSANIVPLVATGVRAKSAARIAASRKKFEKNSVPVAQWPSNFGGKTLTVGELVLSDSGRKHLETQCVRAESRAETDLRRASELRAEIGRAVSAESSRVAAENKQLRAELAALKSDK